MQVNTKKKEEFLGKAINSYEHALKEYEDLKNKFAEDLQKTIELNKFKEGNAI